MQEAHLKLREVIWEITGECNNNCKYCGSKDQWNIKTSEENILAIAQKIREFPPLEINISGGDPLIIPYHIHERIISLFRSKNIICKILVNPKSLLSEYAFNIISKYDWTGISINTLEELDIFEKFIKLNPTFSTYTVITNFNLQNVYGFDSIENFVIKNNKLWTIQFTVYNNENHPFALYNSDNSIAFETLQNKVNNSMSNILLSDNIRKDIPCGAGLTSCGITYDGKVIPCLSMRSYSQVDILKNENSLLYLSLEDIWMNSFKEQRFCQFNCCKDSCLNKCLELSKKEDKIKDVQPTISQLSELQNMLNKIPQNTLHVSMYAVSIPNNVMVYGVQGYYPSYNIQAGDSTSASGIV